MKLSKVLLFVLAIAAVSIAAISSTKAGKIETKAGVTITYIWLKYDCANSTPDSPIPVTGPGNFVNTDQKAIALCPDGNDVVSARKFPISSNPAVDGPQPIVIISGAAQFNMLYPGGLEAAKEAFEGEIKCDLY